MWSQPVRNRSVKGDTVTRFPYDREDLGHKSSKAFAGADVLPMIRHITELLANDAHLIDHFGRFADHNLPRVANPVNCNPQGVPVVMRGVALEPARQ